MHPEVLGKVRLTSYLSLKWNIITGHTCMRSESINALIDTLPNQRPSWPSIMVDVVSISDIPNCFRASLSFPQSVTMNQGIESCWRRPGSMAFES